MTRHAVALLVSIWCCVHAVRADEQYSGRLLEVIDQINLNHPELTVGVDPQILRAVLGKEIVCKLGEKWQEDLKTVLTAANLTTISMKQYDHLLVTTPSALLTYRALSTLGNYQFAAAATAFEAALKQEPDNVQLQALHRTCVDLHPLYGEVLKRDQSLTQAIADGRTTETVARRADRYGEAWGEQWETFWTDYELLAERGLKTELQPLFSFASGQISRFLEQMSLCQRKYPDVVDPETIAGVKKLQRDLSTAAMMVEGHTRKGALLIDRGEALFKDGKKDLAFQVFQDAYEQCPGDLKARTYLGWLQAGLRLTRRQEQQQYLARRQEQPTAEAQQKGLGTFVDWIVRGKHYRQARILLALQRDDRLGVDLDIGSMARLNQVASTKAPDCPVGIVDGLVTRGGEFIGGELFPISVTMGQRQDITRYHELVINDLAQQLDGYLQLSIVQALGWLDQQAKGALKDYRITLHFKDLESAKGGDSLGAAIGTAAFSTLYQLPVRQGLTMTGSIRAYGGIAAVGGIPAKLQAAIDGHKDLIVIPADNEAELFLVSPDAWTTIRVLLADRIDDYLLQALEGAVPPAEIASRDRADLLYWTARAFDAMGRAREAHGIFAKCLQLAPNDYSARYSVDLYARGGIPAQPPAWVDEFQLDETPATQTFSRDDTIGDVPRLLALHATLCRSTGDTANAEKLLAAALALDPGQREALLLKARLLMNRDIPAPTEPLPSRAEVAQTLMARADGLKQADPALQTIGDLYVALVIEYFQPDNENALIRLATMGSAAATFKAQSFTEKIAASGTAVVPGKAPEAPPAFALVPLPATPIDASTLPEEGKIWNAARGAQSSAGEADFADDEEEDEGTVDQPASAGGGPASGVELGGIIEDMKVGANGGVLVVKLENRPELVIVNTLSRKPRGRIKLKSSDILFACGRSFVIVYDRIDNRLTSYSLNTGRQIGSRPLQVSGVPTAMEMGANSTTTVLMRIAKGSGALDSVKYYTLNATTFQLTEAKGEAAPHNRSYRDHEQLRFSPDGKRFGAWCTSHSPSGVIVGAVNGDQVAIKYDHDSYGHILPLGDKPFFVCGGGQVLNAQGNVVKNVSQPLFPDVSGRFFVALLENGRMDVYSSDNMNMLGSITLPETAMKHSHDSIRWGRTIGKLTTDRFVIPIGPARAVVLLGPNRDTLIFHPLPMGR